MVQINEMDNLGQEGTMLSHISIYSIGSLFFLQLLK